jgi:hypothetical protein
MSKNQNKKIAVCGSIGFYKEMEEARDNLKLLGFDVKIPELALEAPTPFPPKNTT